MNSRALFLCVVASTAFAQQRRIPFEFDAGLPGDPAGTQQKLAQLDGKLPASFQLPVDFVELASAPDAVTPPTTRLWVSPEVKAASLRAAVATGTMTWPGSTRCPAHLAFSLPVPTLLISGASSSCTAFETTVRTQLTPAVIDACVDVDLPERYAAASVVPPGLSQTQLNSFVDQHTQSLEAQIALAGAGLGQFPLPDGLLPTDWVSTMRSVLWKLREAAHATRLSQSRLAYSTALSTLTTNAACFDATKSATLQTQVQQLDLELAALQTHVLGIISAGTVRAAQQSACLGSRARTRPPLPIPSLTDEEREFVAFWLGGVYWRMRGGGLLPLGSTQNARTFFARRPLREIARLANGSTTGDRAADSLYCALFDGWGEWMDLGTTAGGQDMYEDLVQLTDRGRQQVADWTLSAVGAALTNGLSNSKSAEAYVREAGFSTTPLFAGGLSMGPCYLYALNPMKGFVYGASSAVQAPYSGFLEGFTAQGEFCLGASLGLGLTRSFLAGTPSNQPPVNFCSGRQCGLDACGVSCGTCSAGLSCGSSGQCLTTSGDAGADPTPDAGADPDAGTDQPPDAGVDAGAEIDAGAGDRDAGTLSGTGLDASVPTLIADAGEVDDLALPSGCGCNSTPASLSWLLGLVLLRRRLVGFGHWLWPVPHGKTRPSLFPRGSHPCRRSP